jgi:hypothetical protein
MRPDHWLPLTEYALRSGMSISTLRRKIKSNAVEYRMEEGRYLIRFDEASDVAAFGYASSDSPPTKWSSAHEGQEVVRAALPSLAQENSIRDELTRVLAELHQNRDEGSLRWRALEARVSGLAKKLETFTEQMAELKMLVRIFEEKLDGRL